MKRLVAVSALAVAVTLSAPASAGAIIQLDRGIAGARLGNTKAEVRTALGQPNRVRNGSNDFGPFTVFVYAGGIRVTFQSGNTVTGVSTTGLGDRTKAGIGVRSTRAAVEQRVPGVSCESFGGTTICQRGEGLPGQRLTAFFLRSGRVTRVTVAFVID
ncbi:MAG TPA: hypothetical protein VGW14_09775 [Thermoleophilaceae bacterium]|nr:hypothetical protein [Thermoleophilaceae bacterium]